MSASDYLIGGNDEHGISPPTAGKRTPAMPYLGRSIYENEFNRPAKLYFLISAARCGYNTYDIHPEKSDISISQRVLRANRAGITLLVTFAYNAFGSGNSFNSVSGLEAYYSTLNRHAVDSRALTEDIYINTVNNSLQNKGRGVFTLSVGVLDSVFAPSSLIEAGYMTNLREARLMLDPMWQKSIGTAAVMGVCEFLREPFISEGNVAAYPLIKDGSRGNYVKIAQYYLQIYGYNISADGIFGNVTASAIKEFQTDNGLSADGIVGRQTWTKLALPNPSAFVLGIGSKGSPVWYLQNKLLSKLYPVAADGIFGKNTQNAVRAFQAESGLAADGVVGPLTWAALNTLNSPRN